MKTTISTTLSLDLFGLAKDNNIPWNKATEFGIQFLIADKDGIDYPDCKLLNKIITMSRLLREANQAREEAEAKLKGLEAPVEPEKTAEQEVEEVFKREETAQNE